MAHSAITLTLTPDEALFLSRLLEHHIVGYDSGPRGTSSHIADALAKVVHSKEHKPFCVQFEDGDKHDRLFLLPDAE